MDELRQKAGGDGNSLRDAERRLAYYEKLQPSLKSPAWRPTRNLRHVVAVLPTDRC